MNDYSDHLTKFTGQALAPGDKGNRPPGPLKVDLHFRLPTPEDLAFVLRAWLLGARESGWGPMCINSVWYEFQQKLIGDLAARPNCRLLVACNPTDPSQLYGFACGEPATEGRALVMHWVYVKQTFRRFGIGKQLLKEFGWHYGDNILATHASPHLWNKDNALARKFHVHCNPFFLMAGVKDAK